MQKDQTVEERVREQLTAFLRKSEKQDVSLVGDINLIDDLGFKSREGLEFVLDLCDEFNFEFPTDFNPFVDDVKRRGQTFSGLVRAIETQLAKQGDVHAKA